MKFENVVIESFNYHLPTEVVSTDEVENRLSPLYDRLKLPKGRLELMTGIKARRVWPNGTRPSALATEAAKSLLADINKEDIGLLIHASVCRDFLEPSTASVVHHNLGLSPDTMIFDLSNACLGVLNSFVMAANMIERGQIKKALIVSGENGGPLLDETIKRLLSDETITRKNIKKYIANLTIGSAAVAYVLSHKDFATEGHELLGGAVMTDASANHLCQGNGDTSSLMMETDSEELMKVGVKLAKKTWEKTKTNLEWNNETPDWAIGHQVGVAHEELTMKSLGLKKCPTHITYNKLGNTGSAALPITLAQLSESEKPPQKGDLIALLGIGSGLSSIMLGVRW